MSLVKRGSIYSLMKTSPVHEEVSSFLSPAEEVVWPRSLSGLGVWPPMDTVRGPEIGRLSPPEDCTSGSGSTPLPANSPCPRLGESGQPHTCLWPALTLTQLCSDLKLCHPQVWTTSSTRPFSTVWFYTSLTYSDRQFQNRNSNYILRKTTVLKHANKPTWKEAVVT